MPTPSERQHLSQLNKSLARTEKALRLIRACAFGGRAEFHPDLKELLDRCQQIETLADNAITSIPPQLLKTAPPT